MVQQTQSDGAALYGAAVNRHQAGDVAGAKAACQSLLAHNPDDALLDADGGGLIVYDKEAPLAWDFSRYNNDEPAIRRFISESGAKSVNVPHRQNRAVVFNSNLFHETGAISFRPGYENRRINITMLYGDRS